MALSRTRSLVEASVSRFTYVLPAPWWNSCADYKVFPAAFGGLLLLLYVTLEENALYSQVSDRHPLGNVQNFADWFLKIISCFLLLLLFCFGFFFFWFGFGFCLFFQRGFLCVFGACPWTRSVDQTASNSHRSTCLCLPPSPSLSCIFKDKRNEHKEDLDSKRCLPSAKRVQI